MRGYKSTIRRLSYHAALVAEDENQPWINLLLQHDIPPLAVVVHERDELSEPWRLVQRQQAALAWISEPDGSLLNTLLGELNPPPGLGPVVHELDDAQLPALYLRRNPVTIWSPLDQENATAILLTLEHTIPPLGGPVVHEQPEAQQLEHWQRWLAAHGTTGIEPELEGSGVFQALLSVELIPPGLTTVVHELDDASHVPATARHIYRNPITIWSPLEHEGSPLILIQIIPPGLGPVVHEYPEGRDVAIQDSRFRIWSALSALVAEDENRVLNTLILPAGPVLSGLAHVRLLVGLEANRPNTVAENSPTIYVSTDLSRVWLIIEGEAPIRIV